MPAISAHDRAALLAHPVYRKQILNETPKPRGLERVIAKAVDPYYSSSTQKSHKAGLVVLAVLLCLVTVGLAGILVDRVKRAYDNYQTKVNNVIGAKYLTAKLDGEFAEVETLRQDMKTPSHV